MKPGYGITQPGTHILTSERRLHGRLDESGEQLRRLGLHGEAGGEGAEGLGVPRQALQGHALTIVGLQANGDTRLEAAVNILLLGRTN